MVPFFFRYSRFTLPSVSFALDRETHVALAVFHGAIAAAKFEFLEVNED